MSRGRHIVMTRFYKKPVYNKEDNALVLPYLKEPLHQLQWLIGLGATNMANEKMGDFVKNCYSQVRSQFWSSFLGYGGSFYTWIELILFIFFCLPELSHQNFHNQIGNPDQPQGSLAWIKIQILLMALITVHYMVVVTLLWLLRYYFENFPKKLYLKTMANLPIIISTNKNKCDLHQETLKKQCGRCIIMANGKILQMRQLSQLSTWRQDPGWGSNLDPLLFDTRTRCRLFFFYFLQLLFFTHKIIPSDQQKQVIFSVFLLDEMSSISSRIFHFCIASTRGGHGRVLTLQGCGRVAPPDHQLYCMVWGLVIW